MSAQDHLNSQQFYSMDKLLSLPSGDSRKGQSTVADVLPRKQAEMTDPHMMPEYYAALRQSMTERGQTAPVEVVRTPKGEVMGEGHHRVALANELGWEGMNVQHSTGLGGDPRDYSDPEFGKRYHWKEGNPA